MYSSQIYCVIKRPFFARAAYHHILPSLLDMYNISLTHISCRVEASDRLSNICEWWCFLKGGCMIILDQVDPSLSDINQRSFYFLILPDSSSGLFVVIRPTSQLSSLSLQCCVAIGFASQSIPGMKAFQFGLEMRFFFTYITRVTRIYGSQQKKLVIVKCSVRTIR